MLKLNVLRYMYCAMRQSPSRPYLVSLPESSSLGCISWSSRQRLRHRPRPRQQVACSLVHLRGVGAIPAGSDLDRPHPGGLLPTPSTLLYPAHLAGYPRRGHRTLNNATDERGNTPARSDETAKLPRFKLYVLYLVHGAIDHRSTG